MTNMSNEAIIRLAFAIVGFAYGAGFLYVYQAALQSMFEVCL
jgi:hypothetical protein